MNTKGDKKSIDVKRTAAIYNMVPNLLWSAVCLIPLTVFCYTWLDIYLLLLFIGCSILPVFLSNAAIDRLQVANSPRTYKQLGVALIQRFTQNGAIINRLIRKKHSDYKVVRLDQKSITGLLNQTYVFEKFHLILFVFMGLLTIYACWKGLIGWAAFLFLANLFYNVYPILLQQYIRIKLGLYNKKDNPVLSAANKGFTTFRWKCLSAPTQCLSPRTKNVS